MVKRVVALGLMIVAAGWAAGCEGGDKGGCFSDDECGDMLVCDRDARRCVDPPAQCRDACYQFDTCDLTAFANDPDGCVKDWCGASFFDYYIDRYGMGCYDAWLGLNACQANLACPQLTEEMNDGDSTYSPYCQAELDQKNAQCSN